MKGLFGRQPKPLFSDADIADALGRWDGREDDPELLASLKDSHGEEKANALMAEVNVIRTRIIDTPDAWGGPISPAAEKAKAFFAERYPTLQQEALEFLSLSWALRNR